jgi:outer membrane protein
MCCRYILVLTALLSSLGVYARSDSKWSLQECIQYAIQHNISIKQDSITAKNSHYALQQSKYNKYPTLNVTPNYGESFGRSINPTTNQFVDQSYSYVSLGASANVLLYSWNQLRNTVEKNKYALMASLADLDQLKDDVSLNVALGFLSAVLAKEQIEISQNQVSLTQAQLEQTRAFVESGRLPELNLAQLESQLATDSSTLINSIANYNSSVLDLKALLNLDMSAPLDIELPNVDMAGLLSLPPYQPEEIYQSAKKHFGSIKGSEYRVAAAEKSLLAAKSALYPQLSLGLNLGSNWASNYQTYSYSNTLLGYQPIGFVAPSGDTVYQPVYKTTLNNMPFGQQMQNNFRQTVSLNLNIPIFNNWQSQFSVKQAQNNLFSQQLNQFNAEITLKQNVYKAYNNAYNSVQKYNAAKRADTAGKRALDFAKKRYDLGLTSTVDFLVTQNSSFGATSNLTIAKYDLIFKLKVLDYYLGKELKL